MGKTNLYRRETKKIGVLRGWKEIRDACGLNCSTQTMRRIARNYFIPLYYFDNRPTALRHEIELWWILFTQKISKMEEEKNPNTQQGRVSRVIKGYRISTRIRKQIKRD
jgi:hypothetical protein